MKGKCLLKKRILSLFVALSLALPLLLQGCSQAPTLKVGMVTSYGVLEDKSFNQATWEGLSRAGRDFSIDIRHFKPDTADTDGYLAGIDSLRAEGYSAIVTTGSDFKDALSIAEQKYKDLKLISVDYADDFPGENTAAILFAEEQAGFLAGVAGALTLKEGSVGGVFGMESPPVQRFNWGFQQGIRYCNENFATRIQMDAENFIYSGSFTDTDLAGELADEMYDRGVSIIFAVAGGAGDGVIQAAKRRRLAGEDVWVIGVDVDQYEQGVYDNEHSVVLTSAMKRLDLAVYEVIAAEQRGEFPGGQILYYDAEKGGIGLPEINPNLPDDVCKTTDALLAMIESGEIVVEAEQGDLIP